MAEELWTLKCRVKLVPVISMWTAIKLRVAGERYAVPILCSLKAAVNESEEETNTTDKI